MSMSVVYIRQVMMRMLYSVVNVLVGVSYGRMIFLQMPVMVPVIMGMPMFMDDFFMPMFMVVFFSYERYRTYDHNR
jgi:hypothetical protein